MNNINHANVEELIYKLRNNVDYSGDGYVRCGRDFIGGVANMFERLNDYIYELESKLDGVENE